MKDIKNYKYRIADQLLKDQLEAAGIVVVQGAKWCGKTTTAVHAAASVLYMDDPIQLQNNIHIAETNPVALFEGATPRVIDEWQLAPQLWDAARFEVSRRGALGMLIFTGSAVPPDMSMITHTGTGRFAWLTMRPMSLWESGDSNGSLSLQSLFEGTAQDTVAAKMDVDRMAFLVSRGGWPQTLQMQEKAAPLQARNYVDAVCNSDITRVDGVERNPTLAHHLMRSYARNQGGQVPVSTIVADLKENYGTEASEATISSYINALKKIFVVEDMPAWSPNLRSKTAIRTSDTRYFVDPSVAVASLGIGPKDLLTDFKTFGLMFETLAVRDLRVYAEALDGHVSHYRDRNGLECDAVIHLRNGSYGLVEVKIGGNSLIEDGVKNLKKLVRKIDTDKMNEPAFMMVLTAIGDFAFRRSDGVWIVPISALKP
ncbi:MAG: ATP-binding protein [Bacteroidales bacterium]|nr:ATP-binding protein [Bacteroidales bacterium]